MTDLSEILTKIFDTILSVNRFATLFKKYRLRAEFEKLSDFGNALSEKGYHYEESIFSHWQKGTRIPNDRKLILTVLELFIERKAIQTREEANEFIAATGLGYLMDEEVKRMNLSTPLYGSFSRRNFNFLTWILIALVPLLSLFFLYFEKTNYASSFNTVPSAVTEPKKLVIGIDATLEPMEFVENDKLVGFDVDLGNYLAKELDADIEFKTIPFDNLFNALDQKQINMIISSVTITDERTQRYNLSIAYLNAGQVILTRKDNKEINEVSDLKGKKIATQTGTTNEVEALKHTSDKFVKRYPDFVMATKALSDNQVDALFTDLPNAKGIVAKNSNLKIVGDPFTDEYYGIVFLKGDPSINQINDALKALKEKGVIRDLERKWLH